MPAGLSPIQSWFAGGSLGGTPGHLIFTSVKIRVRFEGLTALIATMQPSAVEKPMEKWFKDIGEKVKKHLEHHMPIETGTARSTIRVEKIGAMKTWVGTDWAGGPRHPGFPYPAVLAVGGRYHYRAGPFSGGPTAGYHERAAKDSLPEIEAGLGKLASDIARALVP